jgi:Sec-independent protein translocase protein TatA
MFGIGFWEAALILLVGTILLGPQKLAETAKKITHQLKAITGEFEKLRREIDNDDKPENGQ